MRDDQEAVALALTRDPLDGDEDAFAHLGVGLAVLPTGSAREPAAEAFRKPSLGFHSRQPFPRTDADLAKLGELDEVDPLRLRDRLGGLPRAAEVTRIDGVEGDIGESLCQLGRLGSAAFG